MPKGFFYKTEPKFQKRSFKIYLNEKKWEDKIGWVLGNFGVHKEGESSWSYYVITYLPCGIKVISKPLLNEAKKLVVKLAEIKEWKEKNYFDKNGAFLQSYPQWWEDAIKKAIRDN